MKNTRNPSSANRNWLRNHLVLQVLALVIGGPLVLFLLVAAHNTLYGTSYIRRVSDVPAIYWFLIAGFIIWLPMRLKRQPIKDAAKDSPVSKAVINAATQQFLKDLKGGTVLFWGVSVIAGLGAATVLLLVHAFSSRTGSSSGAAWIWLIVIPFVLYLRFKLPEMLKNKNIKLSLKALARIEEFLDADIGYYVIGYRGGIALSQDNKKLAFVRLNGSKVEKADLLNWEQVRRWGERTGQANTIKAIGRTSLSESSDVFFHNAGEHNQAALNTGLYLEYDLSDLENDRVLVPLEGYQASTWVKLLSRLNGGELAAINGPDFRPAFRADA
ncbi:hypothetical protein [Thalassospira sp. HJ]|uniref:hypothetical protein n=1 Tax=Thalassospira sp. HJ TaxID=1616823 RepID=UPI000AD5164A|nr:hypothetical protein [Thalassospira sp. HJ]